MSLEKDILFNRKISRKGSVVLEDPEILKEKKEKISIVSDAMFETMINNESRKKYAAYLISLIFNFDYKSVLETLILEKEKLNKEKTYDSKRTVDFVCTINDIVYSIEMNNYSKPETLLRNIYYATALAQSKMRTGELYTYRKVIQINICNFTFEDEEKVLQDYGLYDKAGLLITDSLRFINIYLPNLRLKYYNKKEELTTLEKYLLVMVEENEVAEELGKGDILMEEYIKEANEASSDEEIMGLYDKELKQKSDQLTFMKYAKEEGFDEGRKEGIAVGRKEGIEQGIKKGAKDKTIEIANNLLNNGISIEIVSESTGLSFDELNNLKY